MEHSPADREHTADLIAALDGEGRRRALDELMPRVAGELRRIARGKLGRERAGHSLDSMVLVNEAYLRLVDARRVAAQGRGHFLAIAANLMRQFLVDRARRRQAAKRGADPVMVSLSGAVRAGAVPAAEPLDVLVVQDLLERLGELDPREAQVVEMKVFAGATNGEIAAALGASPATVKRDWEHARMWLRRELRRSRG